MYLTTPPTAERLSLYQLHHIGVMLEPKAGVRSDTLAYPYFACDNGCFSDKWEQDTWLAWLERQPRTALFAVCPDVVGDAVKTKELAHWLPVIRGMGFAPAYVAQDGVESAPPPWDDFDWLFIGGSTEFKLSATAGDLIREARARGKRVHVGRVNSLQRMRWCAAHGADSADGTFVAFGPDVNLPKVQGWLSVVRSEVHLFGGAA